ncbi:MAG: 6-phosphogluconolactonase [Candidatus Hydrogenedentes bacterium]|nr:6-phosphogluconolactonase [Candidatus Hydrogenedentota bacterium]
MEIRVFGDYEELSKAGVEEVFSYLEKKKKSVICVATGESPRGIYNLFSSRKELFKEVTFLKLDEWGGIPVTDPCTCETYITEVILSPLGLGKDKLVGFATNPKDPVEECKRVKKIIEDIGGIDLAILGLGGDGHIGLNFPGEAIPNSIHIVSGEFLTHALVKKAKEKPKYGFTLGFKEILSSSKIILPVSGASKKVALKRLMCEELTSNLPASFLTLSRDLLILCDRESYE